MWGLYEERSSADNAPRLASLPVPAAGAQNVSEVKTMAVNDRNSIFDNANFKALVHERASA